LEADVNKNRARSFAREMILSGLVVSFLLCLPLSLFAGGEADSSKRAVDELKKCQERADALNEYTLTLIKQERIRGRLNPPQDISVKWKKPLMIYLKINSGNDGGREIIYVKGKNDGKMIVSPGGILGGITIKISPKSRLAMRNNRHSVAEAGMASTIRMINTTIREDMKKPGHKIHLSCLGEERYGDTGTIHVRVKNSSYAARTEIYIYRSTRLIYALFSYDEKGRLIESYTYKDIRTDVGLTDRDFDPKNEEYRF
jgi:outer membrane lipoprotein-sorting protein